MTFTIKTSPEQVERIGALAQSGLSGRQVAREMDMSVSTVAQIIRRLALAQPRGRQPSTTRRLAKKKEPARISKDAKADYSRATVTQIALSAQYSIVCNGTSRERYVPNELSYRGRGG